MLVKVSQLVKVVFFVAISILISTQVRAQETDYHGYKCLSFTFEGHNAKIVFPKIAEKERHWIWRARFWGHEPQAEVALLKKGFHLVFIDAAEYCGNADAVHLWDHFYDYLIKEYQLNSKTVLEGFSRGGLYVYNWGSANVDKVACIYADAPVCDMRSWPGGKGKGKGSPADWDLHLKVYHLTEAVIGNFMGMPVFNARKLAEAGVPVLHVCGAADDVVPIEENSYLLEKTYKEAGGDIKLIVKEGIGHHPHSLKDPTPIVSFILSHTSPVLLDKPLRVESKMAINFRGNIDNCRIKFEKEKKGRVAFLGGSITWNPGWRDMVCDYLENRFPSTEFEFISAGIPSTGSTPGAMRLVRDVLSKGTIDLLFEEAAVNDATNDLQSEGPLRGMEGIIHHALSANPYMDIVMMHFVDQRKMADYNNGKIPEVIRQHEKVARHYNISSINLAKEVNDRIINGEFTWRDDFKNLHPSPFGQKIYFRTIEYFFETSWKDDSAGEYIAKQLPDEVLDQFSYINGKFLNIKKAKLRKGWSFVSDWKPSDSASTRLGFVNNPVLEALQPGATLKLKFTGKAIGLFVTSGPDAGIVEYSIDGSHFKSADQFTLWSSRLHLPKLIILDDELQDSKHTLILRVASDKNPGSVGNACRIHQFAVN